MPNGTTISYQRVPVVGQIAAGRSCVSVEYLPIVRWREVRLPQWARPHDKFVIAEVLGDSLTGVGVEDGDWALIHLTEEVRLGSLAAILTPEGMLIKFFHIERDGRMRLESRHPDYPPRWFEPGEARVQGRVVRTERDW